MRAEHRSPLDDDQKELLMALFAEGVSLPEGERTAFVSRASGDDDALRRELAELLDVAHSRLERFLARPIVSGSVANEPLGGGAPSQSPQLLCSLARSEDVAELPPQIDGYEDLVLISRGGMGVVYRALQVRPVRRPVALKVVQTGADRRTVLARFEAERQALARMAHPHITVVFDAGLAADGRPFFAMELVEGRPLNQLCAEERLGLDERLALFVKVCEAVDHAHRRGVLHRDLKPSNILVTRHGDAWAPKVIDFGIAKALEEPLGELTLLTERGSFIGTPEYMSPEQFDGTDAPVDTRSDVYALGVVLYELIAGALPYESEPLRSRGLLHMTTTLREGSPPKPSTRARALASAARRATGTATEPRAEPPLTPYVPWADRLPGELDWIVMTAIDKEPERRYRSPHELAADVTNYLQDRPVSAGPPSGVYRARKFVRRHRVQVTAAALVLASLVLGLAGTTHYLFAARKSADAAKEQTREALSAQRRAEGVRIATDAALIADDNPNLALLLALEASRMTDDGSVNRTIHRVLPRQRLVAFLEGNDQNVDQLHYLRDGRLLVKPWEPVVLLVDPETGALLRRFTGHTHAIVSMDLHPSDRWLLTASSDGTARLWDVDTGSCRATVGGTGAPLAQTGFSPDGSRFFCVDVGGAVHLYEFEDAALVRSLETGGAVALLATFDPSGQRIATSAADGPIRLWSAHDGSFEAEISRQRLGLAAAERIMRMRIAPRGDRLIVHIEEESRGGRVLLLDVAGATLWEGAHSLKTSFLGADRLLHSERNHWSVIDLHTGAQIERRRSEGLGQILEAEPNGEWAIGTDMQGDLCEVDLRLTGSQSPGTAQKLLGESDKTSRGIDVAFHPDGMRFATSGRWVRVWAREAEYVPVDLPDFRGRAVVASFAIGDEPLVLLRRLQAERPTWELWGVRSLRQRCVVEHAALRDLTLSPCGTRLVGTSWARAGLPSEGPPRLVVLDLDGRILRNSELPPARAFAARPDGRAVLCIGGDGPDGSRARVLDLESMAVLSTHQPPDASTRWSRGARMDRLQYEYGAPSRTDVLDVETGRVLASVRGPAGAGHYGSAVSDDGRSLVIILGSRRAVVYDLTLIDEEGAPRWVAEYPNLVRSNTYECGFIPGGRWAWVQCSNEVHVFEVATGKTFTVLKLEQDCMGVACCPDRGELLIVTREGRVMRWPLDPVAEAKRLAVGRLTGGQLGLFEIGTVEERRARETAALRATPTVRNHGQLAEFALGAGDLDAAIDEYLAATGMGPLMPYERHHYVRLVELLCRRLTRPGLESGSRTTDLERALVAAREAQRCGVDLEELLALPGAGVLRASLSGAGARPQ